MAKIDKEFLKKHQFWVGLGCFVLVWLVAVIMVQASGDDTKQKLWQSTKTKIEGAKSKGPKTVAYQAPWNEHGKQFRSHKDKVWKQAWDQQALIYNWPAGMRVVPQYPDDVFGATVTADQDNRARFRDQYASQFKDLDTYVYPADFLGGFDAVFPKQAWSREREPTREEIWLAQEDFWVRRELLDVVRLALDSAALFHPVKADSKEKLPAGIEARHVLRNANWELNLLLKRSANKRELEISGQSTIKNINVSQKTQTLVNPKSGQGGLPFRIFQENAACVIYIAGEPLAFEKESILKSDGNYIVQPVNLSKPFTVEQLLDWEISPIRRIDYLRVGHHSHRTITSGLKVRQDLKDLDREEALPPGVGTPPVAPPGSPPVAAPAPGPGGFKGGPGGPGGPGAVEEDVTPVNKINRQRYMHVTPQCRHLPIAMRLIVDQAHIQDVLAAMASSRLRIQITQVGFYHVTNVPHERPTDDGRTPPAAGTPAGSVPAAFGPRSGPGGGGGPGPFMPGRTFGRIPGPEGPRPTPAPAPGPGGETPPAKPMVQDGARLVELTIYGVSSLYERFPPRTKPVAPPVGAPPR